MREATKFVVRLVVVLTSLGLVWILFSRLLGPALIESAYRGEALPFLNSIISGQKTHSVAHYLAAWEKTSWRVLGILLIIGLVPLPLVATETEVQRYLKGRFGCTLRLTPDVVNTILAIIALSLIWYLYYFQPVAYIYLISEDHLGEYGTFVSWAMAACFLAWLLLTNADARKPGFVLLVAGALLVTMEEISWGQRILNWSSPTLFAKYNFQGEMNLHNFVDKLSDMYGVLGIVIFLWSILLPLLTRKWGMLRQWCDKAGIPIVPTHVAPFFVLSIIFLCFLRPRLFRSSELAELFLGLSMATLSLDLSLTMKRDAKVEGAVAIAATVGMMVILGILTAFLVRFYSRADMLAYELNSFAARRFPKVGMYRQSEMVFDYMDQQPQFLAPESRLRRAHLLMKRGQQKRAKKILELSLAEQERFKHQWPESAEPYRVLGQVLTILGRPQDADEAFRKAIEKDRARLEQVSLTPDEALTRRSLAETFIALGDYDAAWQQLSMARDRAGDRKTLKLINGLMEEDFMESLSDSKFEALVPAKAPRSSIRRRPERRE